MIIHALVPAVFCTPCLLLGLPWPVFFWPAAFYAGRERAQTECRYIETHGGKRENCPRWCGFTPGAWNAKSVTD